MDILFLVQMLPPFLLATLVFQKLRQLQTTTHAQMMPTDILFLVQMLPPFLLATLVFKKLRQLQTTTHAQMMPTQRLSVDSVLCYG